LPGVGGRDGIEISDGAQGEKRFVKLVVPFVDRLEPKDDRFIQLAEHLGINVETLALPRDIRQPEQYLEGAVPAYRSCLLVNPRVIQSWVGGNALPEGLVSCLTSRFSHLIVHGLRPGAIDANIVAALSQGRLQSVKSIDDVSEYKIGRYSQDICGPFAGLSLGPANRANDCVLSGTGDDLDTRELISIGGLPFMSAVRGETCEVLFIAGKDIADLNAEMGDTPLTQYFSRLMPHAMALRYVFGEETWRPSAQHAALIIDDPLLRDNYGFLNFKSLLHLMKRHRFHTTIAFIPHNYRRNSPNTTRMFRENTGNFSICFHGNDHTGAELAATDSIHLNTMLRIAENRMRMHGEITGLDCDKVMVFPQGKFSVEAMRVLKARNFHAAVNTGPHPMGQPVRLTIRELSQPAILRYNNFPLFLRRRIEETERHDIAFNLFFGKPVFLVAHHDVFQRPDSLAEIAEKINSVAPEIRWRNLATAVGGSTLKRCSAEGVQQVRAYSGATQIHNDLGFAQRFSVEWNHADRDPRVEQVLQNELPAGGFEVNHSGIRASVEMAPGDSLRFAVTYRNDLATEGGLGFEWTAKAFLRRRLSEIRDNHLSKNPQLLAIAKTLQRRLQPVR
jgi:hypothetical protein